MISWTLTNKYKQSQNRKILTRDKRWTQVYHYNLYPCGSASCYMPCIFSVAPGQPSAPERTRVRQSAYEAPTKLRGQQNVKYVQSIYRNLNTKLCGRRNVKHVQRSNCEDWPSIKQSQIFCWSNCSWIEKELKERDKTWSPQNALNWGTSLGSCD